MHSSTIQSNNFFDELNKDEINKDIQYITTLKNLTNVEKEKIIEKFKSALYFISEKQHSKNKIQEYQNIINNFSSIIHQLHEEKKNHKSQLINNSNIIIISSNKLRQQQLKINQQLIKLDQELQQEQDLLHSINDSLILLPKQHAQTKKELNNIKQKILVFNTTKKLSHVEKSEFIALQAEKEAKQFKITELELEQLSANNRQEISRLHIELLKNKYHQLDKQSQILHIQLHNIRQQETEKTIQKIEITTKKPETNSTFPNSIIKQLQTNRKLSQSLKEQIQYINSITLQQRKIDLQTLQIQQTLSKLLEQAQWIHQSPVLGAILRTQISKLPKPNNIHKIQQLDHEMAKLQSKRLQYEEKINKLLFTSSHDKKYHNNNYKETLTNDQKNILNSQITIQKKILNSLLTNCDIEILELTKLKISYEQLKSILQEVEQTIQNYLFWTTDIHPINISYPYKIYQDLSYLLLNTNNQKQIKHTIKMIFTKNTKILTLYILFLLSISYIYTTYHRYYYLFLTQCNNKLKTTHENYFSLTLQNIFWSNIIALPIPTLWSTMGYILSKKWEHPILSTLGEKMVLCTPILFLFIIILYLSSKNGLFIVHFKWEKEKTIKLYRYYIIYTIIITILTTTIHTLNNYHYNELYHTLRLLIFIILCIYVTLMSYNMKQANLPLYINQYGSPNNTINNFLWNLMVISPSVSIIASCYGYLAISQTLLTHLETSMIILFISSIIYYTFRCWILTQKYHIIKNKKHNKKKHIKKNINTTLFPSCKNYIYHNNTNSITENNIENFNNLDIISNQSLKLIRSILILITTTIIIFIWSEFHFIFKYLENITIWDIKYTIQGINNIQKITLKTLLISILIFLITTNITKKLPFLLELIILQYFHFPHGTNYAIITITKYTFMILGITIGCSHIGIEWSKLQWLIAAIGVGLGFGMQEIFANLISGLIILFEKPIRIGDTITICNLTGKITQINTRATTIADRDHKEIIIPNKEFITKKFINWSLSDTITRVVLKVPAPSEANITHITQILLEAVKSCPLVLESPKPEIFLSNIEQGIPLFEIRMHTSKISYRMLLKHQIHILIIHLYKKNGLNIPFPHMQIHKKQQKQKNQK